MGERTEIFLINDGIYLYSHWDSLEDLRMILKSALIRGKERWTDKPYLNRIIFSEMIKKEIMELTGYGISSDSIGDSRIVVNVEKQTVDEVKFEGFIM